MKRLTLLLAALLAATGAAAATQVFDCTYLNNPTIPAQYIPVAPSNSVFAKISSIASGLNWTCKTLSAVPSSSYVAITGDAGKTTGWVTLASLGLGIPSVIPPPVTTTPATTTTVAQITWTAPTVDSSGAPLTLVLNYNVYRGITATTLLLLKNVSTVTTTDTVTVNGTYWYAVTANCAGCTESAKTPAVSALLASGVVVTPAPPTGLSVTQPAP